MASEEVLPPIKGLYRGGLLGHAPDLTTEVINNVRPVDGLEKRLRIGQSNSPLLSQRAAGCTEHGTAVQPGRRRSCTGRG